MRPAGEKKKELHICCPFSAARLPSCITTRSASLRALGLHLVPGAGSGHLDCVGAASDLQEDGDDARAGLGPDGANPRAGDRRRVSGRPPPSPRAQVSTASPCSAATATIPCPSRPPCSSTAALTSSPEAPHVESLELQGFSWISVEHDDGTGDRLKRLTIANDNGSVYTVCIGRLPVLRAAVSAWCPVKHLVMNIASCGDSDTREPFPDVDLAEFFSRHPKLCRFEVQGAMFAALLRKNCLKNVRCLVINCIVSLHTAGLKVLDIFVGEVIVITMRSPSNVEQTLVTLESLIRHSPRLRLMIIRSSKMVREIRHFIPDDFLEEIRRVLPCSGSRELQLNR